MCVEGCLFECVVFIFFVGLLGSGKSWLSVVFVKCVGVEVVLQDDSGFRDVCERVILWCWSGKMVIFDCCNVFCDECWQWLVFVDVGESVVVVYFDVDVMICIQ